MGMTPVSKVGIVHSIDEMHQVARMMTSYLIKIHLLKPTADSSKFLQITNSWQSRCIHTHTLNDLKNSISTPSYKLRTWTYYVHILITPSLLPTNKKLLTDSETCCDLHHNEILLTYLSAADKCTYQTINKREELLVGWPHSAPHSCFRKQASWCSEWSPNGQSLLLTIITISKTSPLN